MSDISSVTAGQVWYSMHADGHYAVLTDGDLGCYAQPVQQHPRTGQWEAIPHEPKVWVTTKQLTQLGSPVGTVDLPVALGT